MRLESERLLAADLELVPQHNPGLNGDLLVDTVVQGVAERMQAGHCRAGSAVTRHSTALAHPLCSCAGNV